MVWGDVEIQGLGPDVTLSSLSLFEKPTFHYSTGTSGASRAISRELHAPRTPPSVSQMLSLESWLDLFMNMGTNSALA
jgi:hypothetical protein